MKGNVKMRAARIFLFTEFLLFIVAKYIPAITT